MTHVTLVTKGAPPDDLTLVDYREIYEELRKRDPETGTYAISLDKFVTLVTSAYSKAQWSKYHNDKADLTPTMCNELRRAVGLVPLPPTVAEATATASPDAAVWQVGDGAADHVIMVAGCEPITLHVNGAVSVATTPTLPLVTPVTSGRKRARNAPRPFVSNEQEARQKALYLLGSGATWREIINRGLDALEQEMQNG